MALAKFDVTEARAASPELLAAASRLFAAFEFEGPLAGLRREAAALAFFAEALASVEARRYPQAGSRIEAGRVERVRQLLDSLPSDAEIRIVDLAAQHGLSVRSLSRHFRATFGTSILGYVAERRMEKARVAIMKHGVTIDQAAHIAGFAHSANFSTAFRRRFGYSPSSRR